MAISPLQQAASNLPPRTDIPARLCVAGQVQACGDFRFPSCETGVCTNYQRLVRKFAMCAPLQPRSNAIRY